MTQTATERATSSQQRASDPLASAWVSANAGSGKTHVLANRVIRLLLEGTDPGRILCLTFTRAAAAEMANRIFETLGKWVLLDDDALIDSIHKISGHVEFEAARLAQARRLFARALETPGGLKVQTIHAFCESLLQRFPLEAGIPPGFQVLDERGSRELLSEARAAALSDGQSGPDIAAALKIVIAHLQAPDFDTVLDEVLSKRTEIAAAGSPDDITARLRDLHGLGQGETVETIVDAVAGSGFDLDGYRAAMAEMREGSTQDRAAAGRIAHALDAADPEQRFAALQGVFLTQKLEARKTMITKSLAQKHGGLADWLDREKTGYEAAFERYRAAVVCRGSQAVLTVAGAVIARYEGYKRHRALLDYDDLINKTVALFESAQAAWVLYKLDGGLDHILVDEAQDTSPDQWLVVAHIAEEFFAGEGARAVARTVFAVGDEKQSIFSFQGADPAKFEDMRRYFERHVGEAQAAFETVPLNVSFRSTPLILSAVDRVFEADQARKGVTRAGDVPVHEAKRAGQPGLVEIWPTVKPDETDEADPWDAPLDWEGPGSPRVRLAERIAAQIGDWLVHKDPLASKGRPIEPGDILILVRRRDTFVDAVVRALKQRKIPVAGADRLVLTDHIAVQDLLALARFVLLAEDDLTLATVLKSPLLARPDGGAFDDDDLFALAHARNGSLWTVLAERAGGDAALAHAHVQLKAWRAQADWQKPYEFFSQVLGPDGARKRFVERLGTEANDPIDEFLGLALQYERQHVPSLQGFVHWMTAAETAIKRDMEHGLNEVRVMTVHGAKGLEANIVFLPDTCTVPDRRHDPKIMLLGRSGESPLPVWPIARAYETAVVAEAREAYQTDRLEEYNRLLYVALTRACDRLYVCGYETKRGRQRGCWYDLVHDALTPEAIEVPSREGGVQCWRLEDAGAGETEEDRHSHDERFIPEEPPPWAHADPPAEPDIERPLAPSRLEHIVEGDPAGAEEQVALSPLADTNQDRFKRGRIIHALLQMLPGVDAAERSARARKYVAQAAFALSGEAQDEILGAVFGVLDHAEFSPLFGPQSRAEVPIIARLPVAGSDIVISGQVDRLVVAKTEVLIVDYKTNRPAPATVETVASGYVRQIAAYRMALAALYPDRTVRGLLLWTDGPMLMELPEAVLERALSRPAG